MVKTLSEKESVTEILKVNSPMKWVQKMNIIRNRVTEIVRAEVIFLCREQSYHSIFRAVNKELSSKTSFGFRISCVRKGDIPMMWMNQSSSFQRRGRKNQGKIERTGESSLLSPAFLY